MNLNIKYILPLNIQDKELYLYVDSHYYDKKDVLNYHFDIFRRLDSSNIGHINLAVGYTYSELFLYGNIGYKILEPYRGQKYASKATKLIL